MKAKTKEEIAIVRIFTDGSGQRPDGTGSGYAWLRKDTGEKKIVRQNGLTNNQAEYWAIVSALEKLPSGTHVEILTDSENTCYQLRGERRVRDERLAELNLQIQNLIKRNKLIVIFTWIPRGENAAGKLI